MWNYWHIHPEVLIGLTLLQIGYLLCIGPLRKRFSFAHDVDPTNIGENKPVIFVDTS